MEVNYRQSKNSDCHFFKIEAKQYMRMPWAKNRREAQQAVCGARKTRPMFKKATAEEGISGDRNQWPECQNNSHTREAGTFEE